MAAVRPTGIGRHPGTADPLPGPTLGFLLPAGKVSSPCPGAKGTRVPPTTSSSAQSHRSLPSRTPPRTLGRAGCSPARWLRGERERSGCGRGAAASLTRPSPTRPPSTAHPHGRPFSLVLLPLRTPPLPAPMLPPFTRQHLCSLATLIPRPTTASQSMVSQRAGDCWGAPGGPAESHVITAPVPAAAS